MTFRQAARRICATAASVFFLMSVAGTASAEALESTVDKVLRLGTVVDDKNEHGDQDPADWDTPWGPLSQYDRNLLINVRWANLWEAPSSGQVAERSADPKVRAVGGALMHDHHALEATVADAAAKLNVALPGSPTPIQQSWQREIAGKAGGAADDAWANVTRQAHGSIFMLIGQVRAMTRNDVVRAFAQSADAVVIRHMTLLESTGLVRASSMVVGSLDPAPFQVVPGWNKVLLGIVLAGFALIGTFAVVRVCARYGPKTTAND
ncbi:DUF4142 domain-containing protein [Amycolatopsis sp. cg5]|uniref:DUF4142 domain-containing protein n=1 Tax=Amycolatopsis sp. cg5 TaxID=3238802 RepID=UPI0035262273